MLLSNEQKKQLCMLAAEAWRTYPEREALLAANSALPEHAVATGWRRAEQAVALEDGRDSLTEATQADFAAIMAHWWARLAEWDSLPARAAERRRQASYWQARALGDGARRARWILDRELAEAGLPRSYAEAICKSQNRCAVAEASERQVWRLIFTIRNRGRAKRPQARHV